MGLCVRPRLASSASRGGEGGGERERNSVLISQWRSLRCSPVQSSPRGPPNQFQLESGIFAGQSGHRERLLAVSLTTESAGRSVEAELAGLSSLPAVNQARSARERSRALAAPLGRSRTVSDALVPYVASSPTSWDRSSPASSPQKKGWGIMNALPCHPRAGGSRLNFMAFAVLPCPSPFVASSGHVAYMPG